MSEMQIVVFSLNNEICGVDTSQVYKIERYQDITKIPQMPDFIEGMISLRGSIVPVVNLNTRFELGETVVSKKTKIIITKILNNLIGFIVNDVSEILRLTDDEIEITPEILKGRGNNYLKGVGKKGDKLISIFDLSLILNQGEIENIDNQKLAESIK